MKKEKESNSVKKSTKSRVTRAQTSVKKINKESYPPLFNDVDLYLFHEGKHHQAYKFMGAHHRCEEGIWGTRFTVWAPNASRISVVGDFNNWILQDEFNLHRVSSLGLWSHFFPETYPNQKYKLAVFNDSMHYMVYKSDPFAFQSELRPQTASFILSSENFNWTDQLWMEERQNKNHFSSSMNIYEMHLGSWRRKEGEFLTYLDLADMLPTYLKNMGYTHVEFMPVCEYPLDRSWGYQATAFYSVNSRYGTPNEFKILINTLHNQGISVIMDWTPGHFCQDEHGLVRFDGCPIYEYQDFNKAYSQQWGTYNFDMGRYEVKSFLISNALFWLNEFHIDGIRMDAISNIIYLNYDRDPHEWHPNVYGTNENLEGTNFLKELNWTIHEYHPSVFTVAEESSSWPNVTGSVHDNGLGFDFKWNMGWMNDTLRYVAMDPIYRKYHHNLINFSMLYHYNETFIVSISHDEVVHGKGSLVDKMWGDLWNKYAGLRVYMTYMMGHPGKKLLFMGSEFAQFTEWKEEHSLSWHIIDEFEIHAQIKHYFQKLNYLYLGHPSLWQEDYQHSGFRWIDANNADQSILSFIRYSHDKSEILIFICNFTSIVYYDYVLGVPRLGAYQEILNSDSQEFGGSNIKQSDILYASQGYIHGLDQYIHLTIPPMAGTVLKWISE